MPMDVRRISELVACDDKLHRIDDVNSFSHILEILLLIWNDRLRSRFYSITYALFHRGSQLFDVRNGNMETVT